MAPRTVALRVFDILQAIDCIERELSGKSFEQYQASLVLRLATERLVEIISEASRHISVDVKAMYPNISWRAIAGIGNILRHDYAGIQSSIIWSAITDDIPSLKAAMLDIRDRLA